MTNKNINSAPEKLLAALNADPALESSDRSELEGLPIEVIKSQLAELGLATSVPFKLQKLIAGSSSATPSWLKSLIVGTATAATLALIPSVHFVKDYLDARDQIQTLRAQVAQVQSALGQGAKDTDLVRLIAQFSELREQFTELRSAQNQRSNNVDAKIRTIDEKVGQIAAAQQSDTHADKGKINDVDTKIGQIDAKIGTIDEKIGQIANAQQLDRKWLPNLWSNTAVGTAVGHNDKAITMTKQCLDRGIPNPDARVVIGAVVRPYDDKSKLVFGNSMWKQGAGGPQTAPLWATDQKAGELYNDNLFGTHQTVIIDRDGDKLIIINDGEEELKKEAQTGEFTTEGKTEGKVVTVTTCFRRRK